MLEEVKASKDAAGCFASAQCKAYLEELTVRSAVILVRKYKLWYATVGAHDILYIPAGSWVVDRVHARQDVFGVKIGLLPKPSTMAICELFETMVRQHEGVEHGKDMTVMQCTLRMLRLQPSSPAQSSPAEEAKAKAGEEAKKVDEEKTSGQLPRGREELLQMRHAQPFPLS